MSNKRILYICSRKFWPPKSGHEDKMYNYCKAMHDKFGYTLDLYVFNTAKRDKEFTAPDFVNDLTFSLDISLFQKARNILFESFFGERLPFQCALFFSKSNLSLIQNIVDTNKYSAIIVDMVRLAPYYKAFFDSDAIKILDMDDALSLRYSRQLQSAKSKSRIQGHYKTSSLVGFLLDIPFIKRMVLSSEQKRMAAAEERFIALYDKTTLVSRLETKRLNTQYNTNKCYCLSLGTDYLAKDQRLSLISDSKVDKSSAVFLGNMAYAPNADSVRFIVKEVLPKCSNIKSLVLIGNCPDEIKKEFQGYPNVIFKGYVEDLTEEVLQHRIFLAPIVYGTGIKTKILDAMAIGIPVITNSIGAEGIMCTNDYDVIIEDAAKEIAMKADLLSQDDKLCEKIVKNAYDLVKNHYDWNTIYDELEKVLSEN